jgi:hypothetical protein
LLRILFSKDRRKIETSDFDQAWEEISRFKESNNGSESPHFMGLQDEHGRMMLLALYDEDRWVLETLQEDWNTQFGRIELAREFKVQEILLSDEELKRTLKTFMSEGRLTIPS